MCIAIHSPQGFVLTEETIDESWARNSDGAGFMYAEDNKLVVVKGLMTLNAFKLAYEPHKERNIVLHFRIKTHGNKDEENTHPFLVDERLGMVHNGILSTVDTKSDQTKSDTWHFTKQHLFTFRKNNHNFYTNPLYKDTIEAFIGQSKLIFMDNKGSVSILNESKGFWDSGCWFSNKSYIPWQQPQPQYGKQPNQWSKKDYHKPKQIPLALPSASNPSTGDLCKTTASVGGTTEAGLVATIPLGSYVKIIYFTTTHWLGIQEVLTGIKAELHVNYLELLKKTHLSKEKYDYEDISL